MTKKSGYKMKSLLPILLMVFIYLPGFLGSICIDPSTSQIMLTDTSEIKLLNDYSGQEGIPTHTLERVLHWGSTSEDIAYDLAIDASDNVYLAGETCNTITSNIDAFVIKYDSKGNLIWNVTWGQQDSNETARAVAVDANYNVYITGYTAKQWPAVYNRMFFAKFNSLGALEWNITYGIIDIVYQFSYGFELTLDGSNIYVVGYLADTSFSQVKSIIWKYHSNGTQLLFNTEFSVGPGVIYGVVTDTRHEVYYASSLTMDTLNNAWEQAPYIWKSNDQLIQEKFYLSPFLECDRIDDVADYPYCKTHPAGGHAVVMDSSNNLYFVGSVFMNELYGDTIYHLDAFIKKYNPNYIVSDIYYTQNIWYRTWGLGHTGTGGDFGNDICNDEIAMDIACSGDNLYVVGFIHQYRRNETSLFQPDFLQRPLQRPTNIFLLNYKTAGTFSWSLSWGSANGNDQAYGIAVDSKENIYIAGYTNNSGAGMGDALLLKYCLIPAGTIPGFEAMVTLLGVITLVYIFFRRPISNKRI